jgi:hypothetical protein
VKWGQRNNTFDLEVTAPPRTSGTITAPATANTEIRVNGALVQGTVHDGKYQVQVRNG